MNAEGSGEESIASRIDAAVEAGWSDQLAWLQTLVRFPSLRGDETDCQAWIAQEFTNRDWQVDRFTIKDVDLARYTRAAPMSESAKARATQIVARLPYGNPEHGRSLILQGHIDVVPTGPEDMWSDTPFSGTIRDGWLHGRGAQDMKAGVAAMVFALDALERAGLRPCAPVFVQSVSEEESTGNGALATIGRGYRADACLIPEPTSNTITRAQSGAVWFRMSVRGVPVHVGRSKNGANAIMAAYRLIGALDALTVTLNEEAASDTTFGALDAPIKFNAGKIRGGDGASSTAAWCDVECRLGLLPGWPVADICQRIEGAIADACADDPYLAGAAIELDWNGFLADGCILQPGSQAEDVLARAHRAIFSTEMGERISTAVNDTRYYALEAGMTALCYGPRGKGMHGADERVDLDNLKKTTKIIARFAAEWCGVTDIRQPLSR